MLLVVAFLAVDLGGWFVEAGGVRADPPAWPPFYQQLAADPDTYTLLELPLFTEKGRGEDHYQAYQAIHHKQRFDGRISRDRKLTNPNNPIKTSSLLRNLWMLGLPQLLKEGYPARDFLQRTDYATQGLAILNYYKVRYIVVYKDALDADWNEAAFQRILQQVLGPGVHPYYEDDLMRVYQVPQGPPAANPLTLDAGEGWYNAETRPDGTTFRWANNTGGQVSQFYSLNLGAAPVAATLRFTILPYNQQPRTVAIALNGKPIITLHLQPQDGETPEAVDLTLPPGDNTITLATPEAPLPTTNPHDARLLSFSMYNVVLQAK